jgi:hypothetical protein
MFDSFIFKGTWLGVIFYNIERKFLTSELK